MMHKRRLVSSVLFWSGALHALKRTLRDRIVVLNYHRIRPDDLDFSAPFDEGVYGPTASQFEAQILWLKRHVHMLSEAELIECFRAGRGPGELSVLITADDGYRDNYTLAYPVLRRHRVPAIFFVPSGFIESRRLGWWDRIAYLLKKSRKPQIVYEGTTLDLRCRRQEAFGFLNRLTSDRMQAGALMPLDCFAQICEVEPPSLEEQDKELMTWEQLKEVREHDIAIGSHTHNHPILSRLDASRQREELAVSKELIAHKIGGSVRTVAYPTGDLVHFTAETQRIAKEVGYELGFSFYSGFNRWPTMDAFDVRRTVLSYNDRIGVAGGVILPEYLSWMK